MGYFSKHVGRPVAPPKEATAPVTPPSIEKEAISRFAAKVGKPPAVQAEANVDRCPRCNGLLAEEDGMARCGGRCGRRWVAAGNGRWLDPATLPFGVCDCCRPRVPLVTAEVGAICPKSYTEYLLLPEGMKAKKEVAPLGICRCCVPPQPLVKGAAGLICRNKPQQHYQVENGQVVWLGFAPKLEQAALTAAIDAALSANNAELTLFGLFVPPPGGRE